MIDKVQKIREEVVRMHNLLPVVDGDNIYLNYADRICTTLEMYIDSLQKEPVSIWHDASKKSDNPEDVVIINPSDNTGEVLTKCTGVNQGHIWAYTSELLKLDNPCNIGKNLQEPQVKESAEIQHVNDMCKENGNSLTQGSAINVWHDMSEDAENGRNIIIIDPKNFYGAVLRKGGSQLRNHNKERYVKWAYIEDLLNLSNVQSTGKNWNEPVNDELEKAAVEAFKQIVDSDKNNFLEIFKACAKWMLSNLNEYGKSRS